MLLLACAAPPGTLATPEGEEPLRTALFRLHELEGGVVELSVLLSNGHLGCALAADAEGLEAQITAACREGASHVALRAYDLDERFRGTFRGSTGVRPDETTPTDPRLVRATWYAVVEAFLVDLDGLGRTYAASEYAFEPVFGSGGAADFDLRGEALVGSFTFPVDDIHGEFRAERCVGDTSLIDLLTVYPVALCL